MPVPTQKKQSVSVQLKTVAMLGAVLMLASLFSKSAEGPFGGNLQRPEKDAQPAIEDAADKQLLELVNQARAESRVPPLEWDVGLSRAAHAHALAMAATHELSHQLTNESSLQVRLSAATPLRMDAEGENVAMGIALVGAHESLMQSPPHRATILDSRFNYVGCAAVWDKGQLWVVEDFAHAMRTYSAEDAEDLIAKAIDTNREKGQLPALRRARLDWLRDVACGMARADSVQTSATLDLRREYNVVITDIQTDPAVFSVSKLPARPDIQKVAVAVCFARTKTYPAGDYWVIVLFY
jgi:uncharacterized protein YkwD